MKMMLDYNEKIDVLCQRFIDEAEAQLPGGGMVWQQEMARSVQEFAQRIEAGQKAGDLIIGWALAAKRLDNPQIEGDSKVKTLYYLQQENMGHCTPNEVITLWKQGMNNLKKMVEERKTLERLTQDVETHNRRLWADAGLIQSQSDGSSTQPGQIEGQMKIIDADPDKPIKIEVFKGGVWSKVQ